LLSWQPRKTAQSARGLTVKPLTWSGWEGGELMVQFVSFLLLFVSTAAHCNLTTTILFKSAKGKEGKAQEWCVQCSFALVCL
jgi:hypothetical protein